MDETYVKVGGQWKYLYRAVDKAGKCKYLNNIVEQDHRAVKRITRGMLGFKSCRCARVILAGIEIMHMIRKGQLRSNDGSTLSAAQRILFVGGVTPGKRLPLERRAAHFFDPEPPIPKTVAITRSSRGQRSSVIPRTTAVCARSVSQSPPSPWPACPASSANRCRPSSASIRDRGVRRSPSTRRWPPRAPRRARAGDHRCGSRPEDRAAEVSEDL
jgi:hypothetical protein